MTPSEMPQSMRDFIAREICLMITTTCARWCAAMANNNDIGAHLYHLTALRLTDELRKYTDKVPGQPFTADERAAIDKSFDDTEEFILSHGGQRFAG